MGFRYLDICSGISAPTMAWRHLGWKSAAYSEIEKFPRAVLAERYGAVPTDWSHRYAPGSNVTPLFGDFTQIEAHHVGPIDLLVGGTPCQDFSIAGLRAGLAGERGNLSLECLRLVDRTRPRWFVWENVPGVLSQDGGRAFGAILGGLGELGYGFAYRVLDAQYVGVPQRRRRVFVVGHIGDWRRAAAVLFERHSLSGHPPPRRETGQGIAPTISARTKGGGGLGTDFDCDGGLVTSTGDIAHCLNAGGMGRQDYETETMIAHSLRGEGFDASEGGTGRGTPLVPVATAYRVPGNVTPYSTGDRVDALTSANDSSAQFPIVLPIAFAQNTRDEVRMFGGDGQTVGALAAEPGMKQQCYVAQAFSIMPMNSGKDYKARPTDVAQPLMAGGPVGGNQGGDFIAQDWAVRRLTPVECHRLQGFPDDHCAITYRGKPAADGPQYKALGNSMAVPVMRWIGERIALVDALPAEEKIAA